MLKVAPSMCFLILGAKEGKENRSPLLVAAFPTPCCSLVVLLGRLFKSYLSFKAQIRIVTVTKFLKSGLSQKIRDVCESLCLRIASAGQPCGFSVGRTRFV